MTPGRPHVVLDALLVTREPTGVGRSILELAEALAAEDRGLDFTVLAADRGPFSFLSGVPRWSVHPCPGAAGGTWRKALFTQLRVPGLCRRLGADLLHSLQFVAPLRLDCLSVVTVHDLAWRMVPGILEPSRKVFYDVLVPASLRRAALILTNSRSTAQEVALLEPGTAGRIRITPFGTPGWARRRLGEAREPAPPVGLPYFLFAGTFEPRKNLVNILRGFESFLTAAIADGVDPRQIPDLLLVGGKGWNDREILAELQRVGKTAKVHTRGFCGPSELWDLYRGARGLVFPSLHEGFGFPILEAMAAGCPVLTSDRGAMREVGGQAALFVDPEDPHSIGRGMEALAWDGELRERLRSAGFLQARRWSWTETARSTLEVYAEALGRSRFPGR